MDKIGVIYDRVRGVMFSMQDEDQAIIHESVPEPIRPMASELKTEMDVICEKISDLQAQKRRLEAKPLIAQLQMMEAEAESKCNKAARKLGVY